MRKVEFVLDKGYPHGEKKEIVTIDDDVTDDEIEDMLNNWVLSQSMCDWKECNASDE